MATNNSGNQKFTNQNDGFDIAGGVTPRKLTVSAADINMVGNGTATITFPNYNATLDVTGYVLKTTTYNPVAITDHVIDCQGTFTVTLLSAVGIAGKKYNFINSGSGVITITTSLSEVIGNGTYGIFVEATTFTLQPGEVLNIISTGAKWRIIT